jgi:hypothetical protein
MDLVLAQAWEIKLISRLLEPTSFFEVEISISLFFFYTTSIYNVHIVVEKKENIIILTQLT